MTGIYVHIPFCLQKCNYCDFCSYPSMLSNADSYCDALAREAESYCGKNIFADTIYFGGGTPSILSSMQLGKVLDSIYKNFDISSNVEITIEANPGTVTNEKAKEFKTLGFNRVSLGAQSFCDKELSILGRIHTADDTEKCYDLLRDAGFENISLDLMYAIPGQNMQSLSSSASQLLNLSPEHISCYGLKIEEGTPFEKMLERGEITEKSDDEYADMYAFICNTLKEAGYSQYELSNFAKKGFESRHNTKYWLGDDYVGLGAAASSKLGSNRFTHIANLESYMKSFENEESYELSNEDEMSEFMFLSLRMTKSGASKEIFENRFGISIEKAFQEAIRKHTSNGMILDEGDRYILAPKAYYISNYVLSDFV
ncbi:MAG: radical SAM family heme chaperone HemW [Clostridia bacterium]|nr:radical SAM family heme chaperone HemW [Clostridia bacterium]